MLSLLVIFFDIKGKICRLPSIEKDIKMPKDVFSLMQPAAAITLIFHQLFWNS